MELTLEAPENAAYSDDDLVVVERGRQTKILSPMLADVSFVGLDPVLAPR